MLRNNGKVFQERDPKKETLYEFTPVIACYRQTDDKGNARCYWTDYEVSKSKPDGGSWSDWDDLRGTSHEMACENINPKSPAKKRGTKRKKAK